MSGDEGNDKLIGQKGWSQTFIGGAGVDTITTDGGKDKIVYTAVTDTGVGIGNSDFITDFSNSSGDVIDLGRLSGTLSFVGTAAFGGNAGEVRFDIDVTNDRTIVGIDLDGNLAADMEIALVGIKILAADDFILTPPA